MKILPAEETTWGVWKKAHPKTLVLSFATGYDRDYKLDPYAEFDFPRARALLITNGKTIRLYPFAELGRIRQPLTDRLDGDAFKVAFDRRARTARVVGNNSLTYFVSYLRDLEAFFPEAEIYRVSRR